MAYGNSLGLKRNDALPKRLVRAVSQLEKYRDIKITRADKGGSVVIMNTDEYMSEKIICFNPQ